MCLTMLCATASINIDAKIKLINAKNITHIKSHFLINLNIFRT